MIVLLLLVLQVLVLVHERYRCTKLLVYAVNRPLSRVSEVLLLLLLLLLLVIAILLIVVLLILLVRLLLLWLLILLVLPLIHAISANTSTPKVRIVNISIPVPHYPLGLWVRFPVPVVVPRVSLPLTLLTPFTGGRRQSALD